MSRRSVADREAPPARSSIALWAPFTVWCIAFAMWSVALSTTLASGLSPASMLAATLRITGAVTYVFTALAWGAALTGAANVSALAFRWLNVRLTYRALFESFGIGVWIMTAWCVVSAAVLWFFPPNIAAFAAAASPVQYLAAVSHAQPLAALLNARIACCFAGIAVVVVSVRRTTLCPWSDAVIGIGLGVAAVYALIEVVFGFAA